MTTTIAFIALRAVYRVQGEASMKQAALHAVQHYIRKDREDIAEQYLVAGKKLLREGDEKGPGNGRLR
jgi:hypothetical protein